MQIKMTQRYHFLPIRLAKIRKFGNTFCSGSYGETSPVQLMGTQNGTICLQGNWAKASKITIYVQAVTWEFHCWEYTPTGMPKDGSTRLFTTTLFVTAKGWKEENVHKQGTVVINTEEASDDKEQRSSQQATVGDTAGQDVR